MAKLGGSSVMESFGPHAPNIGAHFNTFTTKKDVSPYPLPRIPGGALYTGDEIEIEATGEASSTATPNLTIGLFLGTSDDASVTAPAVAITTDIIISAATAIAACAAVPWRLWCKGKINNTGSSGVLQVYGLLFFPTSLTAVTITSLPATAAARAVAINTTIDNRIGVSATWSASSASNDIQVYTLAAYRAN